MVGSSLTLDNIINFSHWNRCIKKRIVCLTAFSLGFFLIFLVGKGYQRTVKEFGISRLVAGYTTKKNGDQVVVLGRSYGLGKSGGSDK